MENENKMKNQIPINREEKMDPLGYYEEEPVEEVMTTENRIRELWSNVLWKIPTMEVIDFLIEKTTFLDHISF